MGTGVDFQFRNEQFFARSRKSWDRAEAYSLYAAQAIPQIDAEIAETGDQLEEWRVQAKRGQKGHFWMETNWAFY